MNIGTIIGAYMGITQALLKRSTSTLSLKYQYVLRSARVLKGLSAYPESWRRSTRQMMFVGMPCLRIRALGPRGFPRVSGTRSCPANARIQRTGMGVRTCCLGRQFLVK